MSSPDYKQEKVISSILYTTQAKNLEEDVKKDLEIDDPDPSLAKASIEDAEIKPEEPSRGVLPKEAS